MRSAAGAGVSQGLARFVIDANAAIKWFIPEIHADQAVRFLDPDHERHVPDLLYLEVGNILWKKVRRLSLVPLVVEPAPPMLGAAFEIALRTGRTTYDSLYLALAAAFGCKLVTADQTLYDALQDGPLAADVLWVVDPF
jgi:predicted nucleic acid-binding protein